MLKVNQYDILILVRIIIIVICNWRVTPLAAMSWLFGRKLSALDLIIVTVTAHASLSHLTIPYEYL